MNNLHLSGAFLFEDGDTMIPPQTECFKEVALSGHQPENPLSCCRMNYYLQIIFFCHPGKQ